MSTNQITIAKVRLKAANLEPLLAQQRIASLLNSAQLHPAGLAPSAILCLRTLRDPLPGSLRLQQGDVHPPPAWQEALTAMLDRLASSASRPARDAVPASSEAVVFLDHSELLACLASDWCDGSVTTRWWWQSLLRQAAASQVVKELWRSAPEYVPAALQQLANKNKAAEFVRTLSDDEAHHLLRGVARSFALHSLVPVLSVIATSAQRQSENINEPGTPRQRETDEQLKPRPDAPWRPWVPESAAAALRPEQELFLGIALMLQRAPVIVRASNFPTKVRDWQHEIALAREPNAVGINSDARGLQATDRKPRIASAEQLPEPRLVKSPRAASQVNKETDPPPAALQESMASDFVPPARAGFESIDVVEVEKTGARELSAPQAEEKLGRHPANAPHGNEQVASSRRAGAKILSATTETDRQATDSLEPYQHGLQQSFPSPETTPAAAVALATPDEKYFFPEDAPSQPPETAIETEVTEEWIETQLGGVFYLINLGLFLGLYGDFTTPDEPGLQLNIWDFVALLGRELVGEGVQDDPVWSLLARLAQRAEDDPPGSGFDPDDEWPRAIFEFGVWSLEFGVSSFQSSTDSAPVNECESPNSKPQTPNSELQTQSSLAAWLDRLLPYVRARLCKALGLTADEDPGPIICRQRARVCVTPTHVDLFFSLAELPIEIRLAGLDRNPGWVPAAGRFITFHFE